MCILSNVKNKKIIIYSIAAVLLLFIALRCNGITKVTDAITNPSARQVYAREFKGREAAYSAWDKAYKSAIADSLTVVLPYGEAGAFNPNEMVAYSYVFEMQEGEMLLANVEKDSLERVFSTVFKQEGTGFKELESSAIHSPVLTFVPKVSGRYKIVIQPEMAAKSNFTITLNKRPLYNVFPVAGKGNAAIGSFWGMDRDGGIRRHEGIDIFAKRGTPVVAVAGGAVTYTGEKGIGGKQVWLRDNNYGSSLYYAHLDSIAVTSGGSVHVGDTLGFVGNTGNAKFTPPHLHFGIYRNYGAVNPLPFVYKDNLITHRSFTKNFNGPFVNIKSKLANLRQQPDAKAPKLGEVKVNEKVLLLGESNDWLHIRTADSLRAFLHKSLVK